MIRSIVTGNYQNAALCLLSLNLFLLPALVQDKMNVGVVWEFFAFAMDQFFRIVTDTVIHSAGGDVVVEGGYLDIGILDTMKKCSALLRISSIIGYITVKYSKDSKIANNFIIRKKNRSV